MNKEMQVTCPLCLSSHISAQEKIPRKQLIRLWKNYAHINIAHLISDDLTLFQCNQCQLQFFYPLVPGDNHFYQQLEKKKWYYLEEKPEYHLSLPYIQGKILEIGCGEGHFASFLPKNTEYYGIDINTQAISILKKKGLQGEVNTIENLAHQHPQSYDTIVAFQLLEHLASPHSFFTSAFQLLREKGKLIVAVPCQTSFLKWVPNLYLNMPPHHITRWSEKTMEMIPQFFSCQLFDLFVETLQPVHFRMYLTTLLENALLRYRPIDLSLRRKIIHHTLYVFSRFLVKGFYPEMRPKGHTMIAVFVKVSS